MDQFLILIKSSALLRILPVALKHELLIQLQATLLPYILRETSQTSVSLELCAY